MKLFDVRMDLGCDEFVEYMRSLPKKKPHSVPVTGPILPRRLAFKPVSRSVVRYVDPNLKAAKKRQRAKAKAMRRRMKTCATVEGIESLALDPCSYCSDTSPTTHDHIEPVWHGGAHSLDNLTRACRACNFEKSRFSLLMFLGRRAQRRQLPP